MHVAYTHVHTHTRCVRWAAYARTHIYTYVHIHLYTHTHTHTHTRIHTCTHAHTQCVRGAAVDGAGAARPGGEDHVCRRGTLLRNAAVSIKGIGPGRRAVGGHQQVHAHCDQVVQGLGSALYSLVYAHEQVHAHDEIVSHGDAGDTHI